MAKESAAKQLATKILQSMYRPNERGRSHSFMYGKPGGATWDKRLGTELYYNQDSLLDAVLFLRENGASYLKRIPFRTIKSKLTELVSENYGIWGNETFGAQFKVNYFEFVSEESLIQFGQVIECSKLFNPTNSLVVFPIQIVDAAYEFTSEHFSIIKPKSLLAIKEPIDVSRFDVTPEKFPPSERMSNRFYDFKSWLCISAPNIESAQKKKSAIIGALALKYKNNIRYQFNTVRHVGGYCSFGDSMSNAIGEPHTPSVHQNIIISDSDLPFLNKLNELFSSGSKEEFRKIRALEYFYRAWFLDESERFPFLFMCLESLYGDGLNATKSIIDGITVTLDSEVPEIRIRLLAELRGSIVHGGAPEIYDSKKYAKYFKKYKVCPSRDLSILVASCINQTVFKGLIHEQPDKHQAIIDEARAASKIPDFDDYNILNNKSVEKLNK